MITVYVQTNETFGEVINISLLNLRTNCTEAILDDPLIDLSKLNRYTLQRNEMDGKMHLILDEDHYMNIVKEKEKVDAIKAGKEKEKELRSNIILEMASDKDAYTMRYLYDEWMPDQTYITGDRKLYNDLLYKSKQDHISQSQYPPNLIPALWDIITDENTNQGTIENPIIVPETVSSMVYVKGKYYKEADTIYLMNREGMSDGEEISLTFKPSQLVGHYFKVV